MEAGTAPFNLLDDEVLSTLVNLRSSKDVNSDQASKDSPDEAPVGWDIVVAAECLLVERDGEVVVGADNIIAPTGWNQIACLCLVSTSEKKVCQIDATVKVGKADPPSRRAARHEALVQALEGAA